MPENPETPTSPERQPEAELSNATAAGSPQAAKSDSPADQTSKAAPPNATGRDGGERAHPTEARTSTSATSLQKPQSAAGDGGVSVAELLSAERSTGAAPADPRTRRNPSTPAFPSASTRLMPRWQRVSCPPGVVPAALVTAVAAAVLIPVDDPGIGWVLTALVAIAAIYLVDRNARRAASDTAASSDDAHSAVDPKAGVSDSRGVDSAAVSDAAWARPAADSKPDAAVPNPGGEDSTVPPNAAGAQQRGAVSDAGDEVSAAIAEPATKDSAADKENVWSIATVLAKVHGRSRVWWTALLILLLTVGAIRSAEWLVGLCVLSSTLAASLAVVGRRTIHGVFYEVVAVPLATWSGARWAFAGLERVRTSASRTGLRVASSVAVTVALLAVFVPLLVSADATFARLLDSATPQLDGGQIFQWIVVFAAGGLGTVGALYLLAGPPTPAAESEGGVTYRRLSRLEWALPVGALTVLFGLFVGVQFAALFGGDDYVQRTAGLTYAEYARSGFWQLLAVSILSLIVILVVLHWAADDSVADRLWLRVLLSAVSVLSLVIVASAHNRMWAYQEAYGFTVQRLIVEVFALWFGLAYLLVLADLPLLRRTWLPRAMIGTVLVTLLALAVVNPERLIAEKNIDRWKRGETLDIAYLTELSPDALPALDHLPAPLRSKARQPILDNLEDSTWQRWNLSRSTAR